METVIESVTFTKNKKKKYKMINWTSQYESRTFQNEEKEEKMKEEMKKDSGEIETKRRVNKWTDLSPHSVVTEETGEEYEKEQWTLTPHYEVTEAKSGDSENKDIAQTYSQEFQQEWGEKNEKEDVVQNTIKSSMGKKEEDSEKKKEDLIQFEQHKEGREIESKKEFPYFDENHHERAGEHERHSKSHADKVNMFSDPRTALLLLIVYIVNVEWL